jgi:hypothetical protein
MKISGRLFTLLLLLASPAVGGTVLPAVHPCPVDAPWTADADDPHAGHEGHDPAPAPGSHDCSCISSCATGPAFSPPLRPDRVLVAQVFFTRPAAPGSDASLIVASAVELLPPSTAPPQALISA